MIRSKEKSTYEIFHLYLSFLESIIKNGESDKIYTELFKNIIIDIKKNDIVAVNREYYSIVMFFTINRKEYFDKIDLENINYQEIYDMLLTDITKHDNNSIKIPWR